MGNTDRKINKVHLLFEQSGTFKKQFLELGYKAYDYDIQNDYGETDFVVDLFEEIENAYNGRQSLLDRIDKDDLTIAFFPCIYFETMSQTVFDMSNINFKCLTKREKYEKVIERAKNRYKFYDLLWKMYAWFDCTDRKLIVENPATRPNYLIGTQNFPPLR